MQRFARIENGIVQEVLTAPDGIDVATMFHAAIVAMLRPCDEGVRERWLFDGAAFAPPPQPPAPSARALRAGRYLAALGEDPSLAAIEILADQIEAVRARAGAARTSEFAALLGTIAASRAP